MRFCARRVPVRDRFARYRDGAGSDSPGLPVEKVDAWLTGLPPLGYPKKRDGYAVTAAAPQPILFWQPDPDIGKYSPKVILEFAKAFDSRCRNACQPKEVNRVIRPILGTRDSVPGCLKGLFDERDHILLAKRGEGIGEANVLVVVDRIIFLDEGWV